jgi:phage/plasmid-associated DNA primase
LKDKLRTEYAGILQMLIERCVKVMKTGVNRPESVKLAASAYIEDEDQFGAFWGEAMTTMLRGKTPLKDIKLAFEHWAEKVGASQTKVSAFWIRTAIEENEVLSKHLNKSGNNRSIDRYVVKDDLKKSMNEERQARKKKNQVVVKHDLTGD